MATTLLDSKLQVLPCCGEWWTSPWITNARNGGSAASNLEPAESEFLPRPEALDVDHGIGSTIHVASVALLAALNLNRTLVLFPQPNYEWVQGKFCEGLETLDECYFEPLSSCSIADAFGSDLEVSPQNLLKFQGKAHSVFRWSNLQFVLCTKLRRVCSIMLRIVEGV